MSMMLILSVIMIFLKHPISMSMILIMQTLTITIYMNLIVKSALLSYMLIIMMLSGVLVLFMYMSSIASNEMFKPSIKLMILMATLIYWLGMPDMILLFSSSEMNNKIFDYPQSMNLRSLFSEKEMWMTLTMVTYLFITMIVVSYITNTYEGPLRSKT
nr:NADH dehydrogenase subunit 6 [Myrmedobia distinguenda]